MELRRAIQRDSATGVAVTVGEAGGGTPSPGGTPAVHALAGDRHSASGLTVGDVLQATGSSSFGFGPVTKLGNLTTDVRFGSDNTLTIGDVASGRPYGVYVGTEIVTMGTPDPGVPGVAYDARFYALHLSGGFMFGSYTGTRFEWGATGYPVVYREGSNVVWATLNYYNDGPGGSWESFRARGTHAAPTPLLQGDVLGEFALFGYTGTSYTESGCFRFYAAEDFGEGATRAGTGMQIETTPTATAVKKQVWAVTAAGHLVAGRPAEFVAPAAGDNTYDIGLPTSNRPRAIYVANSVVIGTDPTGASLLRVGGAVTATGAVSMGPGSIITSSSSNVSFYFQNSGAGGGYGRILVGKTGDTAAGRVALFDQLGSGYVWIADKLGFSLVAPLLAWTDNSIDLGAAGATRFRTGYFGTSLVAPLLNLAHGSAPVSPVNGDVWTTTAGMYARINGATVGPFGVGGSSTVADPNLTVGTAPADGMVLMSPSAYNAQLRSNYVYATDRLKDTGSGRVAWAISAGSGENNAASVTFYNSNNTAGAPAWTSRFRFGASLDGNNAMVDWNLPNFVGTALAIYINSGLKFSIDNAGAVLTTGLQISGTGTVVNSSAQWVGPVVAGQYGGTGVANTGKTLTLSASWTLGTVQAAAVALDAANYVAVTIGGVAYKLALVT